MTSSISADTITDIELVVETARALQIDLNNNNNNNNENNSNHRVNYNEHVLIIGMSAGDENENPQEVEAGEQ